MNIQKTTELYPLKGRLSYVNFISKKITTNGKSSLGISQWNPKYFTTVNLVWQYDSLPEKQNDCKKHSNKKMSPGQALGLCGKSKI